MMVSRLSRTQPRCRYLLALMLVPAFASADAAGNAETIRAVLNSSCLGCHNDSVTQGGLNFGELGWDLGDLEIPASLGTGA